MVFTILAVFSNLGTVFESQINMALVHLLCLKVEHMVSKSWDQEELFLEGVY